MLSAICRESQNQNHQIRSKILESFPTISVFNIVHYATDCNPLRSKIEKFCIFPNLPTRNLVTLSTGYVENRFHISPRISIRFQNAQQNRRIFWHPAVRGLGIGQKHAAVSDPASSVFESSHLYIGVTVSAEEKPLFFLLRRLSFTSTQFQQQFLYKKQTILDFVPLPWYI